jgi:hypothetical protein
MIQNIFDTVDSQDDALCLLFPLQIATSHAWNTAVTTSIPLVHQARDQQSLSLVLLKQAMCTVVLITVLCYPALGNIDPAGRYT